MPTLVQSKVANAKANAEVSRAIGYALGEAKKPATRKFKAA